MIIPSCKDVARAAVRGELTWTGHLHLMICAGCRRFCRQLALISEAMRASVFVSPHPARVAELEKSLLARLRQL